MREILFMGKRVDSGEWVEGDLGQDRDLGTFYIQGYDCYTDAEGNQREPFCHVVTSETVGQYTGLKDKNGKRIFEGDIFHIGDRDIPYKVLWHDTGLIGKALCAGDYIGLKHWNDRIEVIGNIHDKENE